MNRKHRRTIEAIFADPVRSNIAWRDIEKMLVAAGAKVEERAGSRVAVLLNDRVGLFHRPHPEKETDKGAIRSVREYLLIAGVVERSNAGTIIVMEN